VGRDGSLGKIEGSLRVESCEELGEGRRTHSKEWKNLRRK
jgi:hypothetical protein